MSKKTITIIVIVFAVILALVLGYVFFASNQNNQQTQRQDVNTFFPFGTTTPDGRPQQDLNLGTQTATQTQEQIIPKLRQISNFPVSGYIVFDESVSNSTSTETKIRYFDKGTGHIFETTKNSLTSNRIVNTTFPKTYEVVFTNKSNAIARYLDNNGTVKTLLGSLTLSTSTDQEGTFSGTYLSDAIDNMSVAPNKSDLVSLLGNTITKTNIATKKVSNLITLDTSEFLVSWPNQNNILLVTKPDSSALGYAYTMSSSGGVLNKVAGPLNGLMVTAGINPSLFVISNSTNRSLDSFVLNRNNNETTDVQIPIIPDKCVWSKKNQYLVFCAVPRENVISNFPENWYKGLKSFSDDIWRLDVSSGISTMVSINSVWRNKQFDVVLPSLNEEENTFYFIDKKDQTLWSYDFEGDSL